MLLTIGKPYTISLTPHNMSTQSQAKKEEKKVKKKKKETDIYIRWKPTKTGTATQLKSSQVILLTLYIPIVTSWARIYVVKEIFLILRTASKYKSTYAR